MRTSALPSILACAWLGVVACTPSVKVSYNYDPDVDFFTIESFRWGGMQSNDMISRFDVSRMESALRQELVLHGLLQRARADVVAVAYLGIVPGRKQALEYSHGLYWTETTKTVQLGTVVLDLVDTRTNRLIWRGVAQTKVEEDISPQKRQRNIERVARKLVSTYPPPQ